MSLRIGIDVGGTKIAAALVDDSGLLGSVHERATDTSSADALVSSIVDVVAPLLSSASESHLSIAGIGLGIAGLIDHDRGLVRFAPHLPVRDEPVGQRLAQRLGHEVSLENDATAAAWGEFCLGAGRGALNFLMVSVGTGIGGGIVVGGSLLRGSSGTAGEIGHVPFVPDGHLCGCGARGCWEQYASGNALGRRAREAAGQDPATAHAIIAAAGNIESITGQHVAEAIESGDACAAGLLSDVAHDLGTGIAGLVAVLDPDVVVIGGGLAAHGERILAPAQAALNQRLIGNGHRPCPELTVATLGPYAALVGAALAQDCP